MNTMNRNLNHLQKQVRAKVIKQHLQFIGQNKCVCFTCGNASKYLMVEGLEVIEVINPINWWTYSQIQQLYRCFDATSGHLSMALMSEIAHHLKAELGDLQEQEIACGSGETFVCLKMAFPFVKLNPIYNLDAPTKYNDESPLNNLVDALKNL